jgi:hypothetical protein
MEGVPRPVKMPDSRTFDLSQDQDFLKAPAHEQMAYLAQIDPDFASANPQDQAAYLAHVTGQATLIRNPSQQARQDLASTPMKTSLPPRLVRGTTAALPAAGALAAGAVSSPTIAGTAVGAGLGAAAGEQGRLLANRAIFGPDEPSTISKEGLKSTAVAGASTALTTGVLGVAANAPSYIDAWNASRASKMINQSVEDFTKAVPPSKSAPYTPRDYQAARPYLEAEHGNSPVQSVQDLRDSADTAIGNIEGKIRGFIQAKPRATISTDPLSDANAVLAQNARGQSFVDQGMKELEDFDLGQPKTLAQADNIRKQLNAENKAVLRRNNYDVATARATDPGFAAREAAAESLRNGIYDSLEANGVSGVRDLRLDEGAIIKIRNAAQNQIYNGGKAVSGTGSSGPVRQVGKALVKAGGTAAGASVGGVPGAIVGAGAGEAAGSLLTSGNLTRDALIERSFSVPTARPPVYPARQAPVVPIAPAAAATIPLSSLLSPAAQR